MVPACRHALSRKGGREGGREGLACLLDSIFL